MTTFEVTQPFRIRMPNAVRWKTGEADVDSVDFDGEYVTVTYHETKRASGWWCKRFNHEFEWLPEVHDVGHVVVHYVDWLEGNHGSRISPQRRGAMKRRLELQPAGSGYVVRVTPQLAGLTITGGNDWIYVLSGDHSGAIRVPTSAYQWYPIDGIEVFGEGLG